jgi:hypothetical protein
VSATLDPDRSIYELQAGNILTPRFLQSPDRARLQRMPPGFLKIDVGGHEGRVFLGPNETIGAVLPLILADPYTAGIVWTALRSGRS